MILLVFCGIPLLLAIMTPGSIMLLIRVIDEPISVARLVVFAVLPLVGILGFVFTLTNHGGSDDSLALMTTVAVTIAGAGTTLYALIVLPGKRKWLALLSVCYLLLLHGVRELRLILPIDNGSRCAILLTARALAAHQTLHGEYPETLRANRTIEILVEQHDHTTIPACRRDRESRWLYFSAIGVGNDYSAPEWRYQRSDHEYALGYVYRTDLGLRTCHYLARRDAVVCSFSWWPLAPRFDVPPTQTPTTSGAETLGSRLAFPTPAPESGIPPLLRAELVHTIAVTDQVIALQWDPDDHRLHTVEGATGTLNTWHSDDGSLQRSLAGHKQPVLDASWSPTGHAVALAEAGVRAGIPTVVTVWSARDGRRMAQLPEFAMPISRMAWSPDSRLLAIGTWGCAVEVWDITSTTQRHRWEEVCYDTAAAWSPDGQFLAFSSTQDTIEIWNIATGTRSKTIQGPILSTDVSATRLAWSPAGDLLAEVSGHRSNIRLWQVSTGKLLRVLPYEFSRVTALAFRPDGGLLAIGTLNDGVALWSMTDGKLMTQPEDERRWIASLAWSATGERLAAATDSRIEIWRIPK